MSSMGHGNVPSFREKFICNRTADLTCSANDESALRHRASQMIAVASGLRREISCGLGLAASENCPDKCDHDVASCAQSVDWLSAGLRPQLGVDRKWSTDCQTGALDPFETSRAHSSGGATVATWMRNLAVLARTLAVVDPSTS
jgi:hypothetical protein